MLNPRLIDPVFVPIQASHLVQKPYTLLIYQGYRGDKSGNDALESKESRLGGVLPKGGTATEAAVE